MPSQSLRLSARCRVTSRLHSDLAIQKSTFVSGVDREGRCLQWSRCPTPNPRSAARKPLSRVVFSPRIRSEARLLASEWRVPTMLLIIYTNAQRKTGPSITKRNTKEPDQVSHSIVGDPVATIHGLSVYMREEVHKSTGARKVIIQIRQGAARKWRVSETLCYSNAAAVDIKLELGK